MLNLIHRKFHYTLSIKLNIYCINNNSLKNLETVWDKYFYLWMKWDQFEEAWWKPNQYEDLTTSDLNLGFGMINSL